MTETKLLKLIYKKNKIIKSIEVHESGCIVTEVDPIRHHLNIKKIIILNFLKNLYLIFNNYPSCFQIY